MQSKPQFRIYWKWDSVQSVYQRQSNSTWQEFPDITSYIGQIFVYIIEYLQQVELQKLNYCENSLETARQKSNM